MKRHQQIMVGVLAVQIILSVIVFWPRPVASGAGALVFPDLKAEEIVALTVTDNAGVQIALRKVEDAWVLPDAGDYPVKESALTPLLEKLTQIDQATLVARTEASHKPLEVADDTFQRRLEFETAAGERHTVYLGTAPRYTATHFRVDGQSETYLTTELSSWEFNVGATTWIDTAYTSLDQETLARVVLENAQGTFTLVKEDDAWTLSDLQADEKMSAGKVGTLVRNASNLSMAKPLGKSEETSYGLDAPNAVVTLETVDGSVTVLTVGARDDENQTYVVKYSDSPYYVSAAEYNVKSMVEYGREDFLAEPATPEAMETIP